MNTQVIHIHQNAPEKPQWGDPCNGCGICCLAEPCPIGQIIFLQRSGPCPAIMWNHDVTRYECGMVIEPSQHRPWLPKCADRFLSNFFKRWIAAGIGCDSSVDTAH